ncbi:hypothetical protein SAMN04487971_11136 [Paracoccus chinensis]|uniref:Uncharacterized protein n=1 Tax=Paracoccus chinensis TaxID=525640 RepID=A0A1G9K8H2_9RHOB|nr:hypothetical protein SAMN04487971_11136 [Paracoccus chinensis]
MDACRIRKPAHYAIKCINFTDEMALSKTSDGRIAGHRSGIVQSHGNQCNTDSHPRGSCRSFQTSVTCAYDQYIIMFHVKHLLADAEAGEDLVKVIIGCDASNHLAQSIGC